MKLQKIRIRSITLMGTITKHSLCHIAVMAENLEAHRKVHPNEPRIKFCSSSPLETDRAAMTVPVASNVINSKKFKSSFLATGATESPVTVMGNYLVSSPESGTKGRGSNLIKVLLNPLQIVSPISLFPERKRSLFPLVSIPACLAFRGRRELSRIITNKTPITSMYHSYMISWTNELTPCAD